LLPVRVDVLGPVAVVRGGHTVAGAELGGRRARVTLVALALCDQPLAAEQLASMIWGEELPATWQVALRGIVSGLRHATVPPDGDQRQLIQTAPWGYHLADGVLTDIAESEQALREAEDLLAQGRHQAAAGRAEPVARLTGDALLPGEQADWIAPHRRTVDLLALRATGVLVSAASAGGDHDAAIAAARRAVAAEPLDERAHRWLIRALDRAGDRASAVRAFEHCRAVLGDQLGIDPSEETVRTYLAALQGQATASKARLPTIASTFVGREAELEQVRVALAGPGLLTITGVGGVGKSRLAVRAADRSDFAGGRLWVSLSMLTQDALVAATVALEIGAQPRTDDAEDALSGHLAPLGRTLLVLDGVEGALDGAASLCAHLLSTCPQLTVVVTSRAPLSVEGEQVLTLTPLPHPEGSEPPALLGSPQVRLLLDRVTDGGGELIVDDRLAAHLTRLLSRCGGLPLALELVAAQLAAIPVGDLLDHLDSVEVEGDDRLRSIARSSYSLLDDEEATVFRRLAVLDGWVGLPLVRKVVAAGSIPEVRVVRILRELSARGLVSVDRSGPRWRYAQDDDLHRYARELLAEAGQEHAAFDRLADAIAEVLPADARSSPLPFQDRITDMLGCVRSLFAAAIDGRADPVRCLELAFRLHRYFASTNGAEGRLWLGELLVAAPVGSWTPYATFALGYLSYWSGDTMQALTQLQAAVDMMAGVDDPYVARALIYLAGLLDDLDRGPEAVEQVRRAIEAAAPFDVDLQVSAAMGMGSVLAERGDRSAAGYADDAIARCRQAGSPEQLALALPTAAMICWQVGAYQRCRDYVEEARPMHAEGRRIARVVLLSVSAGLALSEGDHDAAVDLGAQADEEAGELGVEREVPLIRTVLARAHLARGELAAAGNQARRALAVAEAMTITFPLAMCFETTGLVTSTAGTTARQDLADLLATAALLRSRGDRPCVPSLTGALDALRSGLPSGRALDLDAAVLLAHRLLDGLTVSA
jgi:predicted ATPase/DNA-binding SARP family transcriptional activator